jgi:tetratricopeptide (TPR) repeat protein
VIGRVFWTGPVRELVEGASPDFELLEEREFIIGRAGSSLAGEREFVIRHALTRQVAYESLLKARRAPLHAAFADWLERNGEGEDEHAPLLAHHYAAAVQPEDVDLAWSGREEEADRLRVKAVRWCRRAAELAVGRYEIDEGLSLLHSALELEPTAKQQAELWQRIAHASALKFDGEGFWAAMEKAIELAGPSAELHAELALQSVWRAGMWTQEPDWGRVEEWANRALEAADEGSLVQGRALVALAQLNDDEVAGQAAYAIAERLDDNELRALALLALTDTAQSRGELDEACQRLEAELQAFEQLGDPDARAKGLLGGVFLYLKAGRIAAARDTAALHAHVVAGLTPHHRMHGAGLLVLVDALAGRWDAVRALTPDAEQAVDANLEAGTPCPMNVAILLMCAAASARAGTEADSRRLESKADAIGMSGYRPWFEPVRLELALARNDLAAVRSLVPDEPAWLEPPGVFFDCLVALGDRARIESEAPKWLQPGTYTEPFALRALGVARADQTLIRQAVERFEAMHLSWHVEQTEHLVRARAM